LFNPYFTLSDYYILYTVHLTSGFLKKRSPANLAHLRMLNVANGTQSRFNREHAEKLDHEDPLRHLRQEFIIPTKAGLKRKRLSKSTNDEAAEPCIYFCGNSLGLQPRRAVERVTEHLSAWAERGVTGHFTEHGPNLPPFLYVDDVAAEKMAPVVGATRSEVAVMETLTANLHLMMASFYQPTEEKHKIILEAKAFPSDHYAVDSQIRQHGFDPRSAMVLIEPEGGETATISTSHIKSVIDKHAASTALILLPGVQYYTGQYLDIPTITAHAHSRGILIGWDLAHAVGNVEVKLHDWDVDFAVWCNYKYLNSGPGSIAGLFVHEKHGHVDVEALRHNETGFRPRLSGWWGGDRSIRFGMGDKFVPIPGAAGYQLGNPSVLALSTVLASLEVFALTSMSAIQHKSRALTGYLADLLTQALETSSLYHIITPSVPNERGAQLSVRLKPGLLNGVMKALEEQGVVVDERQPDVVRVAPAPLYNTFTEVWVFVKIFRRACDCAQQGIVEDADSAVGLKGQHDKGWNTIK
jgi:kynureninase